MDGKIIRNKLIGSEEERAVSPVIGVILMVAITVILAAVIAAFVLDIGPGQATVTGSGEVVDIGSDTVDIEITDGSEADQVVVINSAGEPVADGESASTGATVDIEKDDDDDYSSDTEYRVYLISGEISGDDDSIDAADASTQIDSFEGNE